jgi:hypothetical protein
MSLDTYPYNKDLMSLVVYDTKLANRLNRKLGRKPGVKYYDTYIQEGEEALFTISTELYDRLKRRYGPLKRALA